MTQTKKPTGVPSQRPSLFIAILTPKFTIANPSMRPITRSFYRQRKAATRTRLQARKMDDSFLEEVLRDSPYNTRSSPTKVDTAAKEKVRLSYKWSDQRRDFFLELCVEEHNNGKCSGGSFKMDTFKRIAGKMSNAFEDECTGVQCKNFWNKQKQSWSAANTLRNATGLGLDPIKESVVADDDWWNQAAQVCPNIGLLKDKNAQQILYYGDILFKNNTATGEHVIYPATAAGANCLDGLPRRLDLNYVPVPDEPHTLPTPYRGGYYQNQYLDVTPGSGSTVGGKRKSSEVAHSHHSGKKRIEGSTMLEKFDSACKLKNAKEHEASDPIPTMEMCWPHLIEMYEFDDNISTYGSTMLGNNERQRSIFLGWPTVAQKMKWLMRMEKDGYK